MNRRLRTALWVVVLAQAVVALGTVFQLPGIVDIWPYGGRTSLTNIFIGSIYAAAAASTAWCLLAGSVRAFVGIALDYVAIFAPFAAFSLVRFADGMEPRLHVLGFAIVSIAGTVTGLWAIRVARRQPWRAGTPTPGPVRASFVVFIGALWIVAAALFTQRRILPWPVTDELSILIGFMFLGASVYFLYGVLDPHWENAGGQLAGFLAYDVVLIAPFLVRLPTVPEEFRVSLIIYTAVVVFSGVLAVRYLVRPPRASEVASA